MTDANKLVKKWRKVLDASDPLVDEENAAICLEAVQKYFEEEMQLGARAPVLFIPMFRRILSSVKLHFDPTFKTNDPLKLTWSSEISEEVLNTMKGIFVDIDLIDVMSCEIERQMKEIGNELIFNFELADNELNFYAKPYEE